jgi:predicted phage replisome organizer
MSDNKRYYWLKLKEDFFEDDTMQYIEEQENGKEYLLFYLKLCVKSLKNDGILTRYVGETIIPYDAKALAKVTNTELDTVKIAMEAFEKIGVIQILDSGEISMSLISEMIGSETDSAKRMRKARARQASHCAELCKNVTQSIEKELEKDIYINNKEQEEKKNEIPFKCTNDWFKFRKVLGMDTTDRNPTAKEEEYCIRWIYEFDYSWDDIKQARDISIENNSKPVLAYMHKVLETEKYKKDNRIKNYNPNKHNYKTNKVEFTEDEQKKINEDMERVFGDL